MRFSRLLPTALATFWLSMAAPELGHAADASDPLDQGWNAKQISAWYNATQGSRLIPLAWLKVLTFTKPDGTVVPFLANDRLITAYRYLRSDNGILPIGFVIDDRDDREFNRTLLRWKEGQSPTEPWVGMTCSACHTAQINYKNTVLTIQGGAALADFQNLIKDLNNSLSQTSTDSAKFDQFAQDVLGTENTATNKAMLKAALTSITDRQQKLAALNATDLQYGFGRLDAVGNILNKVAFASEAPNPAPNPSDAPVSYPFLWNTPQQDKIEWDGIAQNIPLGGITGPGLDVGALGRNVSEVLGVFGDVKITAHPGLAGYSSSVEIGQLADIENLLRELRPPKWPDAIPRPMKDDAKRGAGRGQTLFAVNCSRCHNIAPSSPNGLDRTDLHTKITVTMSSLLADGSDKPIGTDPWMACNAVMFSGPTGNLVGLDAEGTPLGDTDQLFRMLTAAVPKVIENQPGTVFGKAVSGFFGIRRLPRPGPPPQNFFTALVQSVRDAISPPSEKEQRKTDCFNIQLPEIRALLAYKARPLNGIWATPPYLHNGSVPTLYDLLLPPSERPPKFNVGTREFDPDRVGFVTSPGPDNSFVFDTTLEGNSNAGHEYGTSLSPDDRWAIVEYLKGL